MDRLIEGDGWEGSGEETERVRQSERKREGEEEGLKNRKKESQLLKTWNQMHQSPEHKLSPGP